MTVFQAMRKFNELIAFGSECAAWQDFVADGPQELGMAIWEAEECNLVPDQGFVDYWMSVADGECDDYDDEGNRVEA